MVYSSKISQAPCPRTTDNVLPSSSVFFPGRIRNPNLQIGVALMQVPLSNAPCVSPLFEDQEAPASTPSLLGRHTSPPTNDTIGVPNLLLASFPHYLRGGTSTLISCSSLDLQIHSLSQTKTKSRSCLLQLLAAPLPAGWMLARLLQG